MKKIIILSVLFAMGVRAEVIISNSAGVSMGNVTLSQSDYSGSSIVQARNRASNLSDWRAITQTFIWNSNDQFDGIGLYMGAGNDTYWTEGKSQTYVLVIQKLESNLPVSTVLNAELLLTDDKVSDNQWIYFDTENVALENGQLYGFSLCPAETSVNSGLRTFWATGSDGLFEGIARQYAPNETGDIPKSDSYSSGGGVNDYALYMQTVPEPATAGLVLVSSGLLMLLRRR